MANLKKKPIKKYMHSHKKYFNDHLPKFYVNNVLEKLSKNYSRHYIVSVKNGERYNKEIIQALLDISTENRKLKIQHKELKKY